MGPRKKYSEGEEVMCRWPGSQKFYPAKIKEAKGLSYSIRFEDGTIHKVAEDNIKKKETLETEVRRITRSRSRSPSSTNVPSRRKKSPARRRSSSRSRSEKVLTVSTPTKDPSIAPEPKVLRRSPRVRMARVNLNNSTYLKASSDEEDEKEVKKNHKEKMASPPKVSAKSSAQVAALQAAKVAGVVTPRINVTDSGDVKEKNKRKPIGRHFGGVFGVTVSIVTLPFVIFYINLLISYKQWNMVLISLPRDVGAYFDPTAVAIYFGWILFQGVLYTLPLGPLVKGQPLRDGTCLKYRLNGIYAFFVSVATLCVLIHYYNPVNIVYNRLIAMMVTSIIFSYVLSIILYVKSHWSPVYALSSAGRTGNVIYDFFMGRELNPSLLGFDLKTFLELRTGLIGWAMLNICILWKDYVDDDAISPNLALSAVAQICYCADALYFEESMISTMDIKSEGLGFMLVFGNLCFVPFVFSIQSRYLLEKQLHWPWYCLAPIAIVAVVGYFIFRLSNGQKDEFRRNPHSASVAGLSTINTGLPQKILCGGWWGWLRHPNYLGDIVIALSFCLPAGFDDVIPYTYLLYLLVLLCHRATRDDDFCQYKYGASWDTYRMQVRWRIFPHIF